MACRYFSAAAGRACLLGTRRGFVAAAARRPGRPVLAAAGAHPSFLLSHHGGGAITCPQGRRSNARPFHASAAAAQKRDYYDTLGISRDASKAEIKKKYYQLAKKWHPDANQGDDGAKRKFQEVTNAYEVLSDDSKRGAYDRFGHAGVDGQAHGGGGGGGMGGMGGMGGNPEDIFKHFEQMFGGQFGGGGGANPFAGMGGMGGMGGGGGGPAPGDDTQTSVTLDFLEAAEGCVRDVNVAAYVRCDACDGHGSESGRRTTCPTCHGRGQVQQAAMGGFFQIQQTCPTCRGAGEVIADPCGVCRGEGRVRKNRTIQVTVPAGVDSGMNLRLGGQGDVGKHRGPNGNLYVSVQVRNHEFFRRDGDKVYVDLPVSVTEAILGTTVDLTTLKGEVELNVKPGTQPNDQVVLRRHGVQRLNSGGDRGPLYVTFKVQLPSRLTPRQKELLEEFEAEEDEKAETPVRTAVKDTFAKMRSSWSR